MAVFVSQIKSVAHGGLNWDTSLNTDMANLENVFQTFAHLDRSGDAAITVTNWNSIVAPGTYVINGGSYSNYPVGAYNYGILEVVRSSNYIAQRYHALDATIWFRSYDGNTWSAWMAISQSISRTVQVHGTLTFGAASADGSRFSATGSVTFANNPFTVVPIVQLTLTSSTPTAQQVQVTATSSSGFTAKAVRDNTFGSGLVINWSAFSPS